MKPIIYLVTGFALVGLGLTGCSEDRFSEVNEQVNESVTDVPEGCIRVSFVPKGQVQTRGSHQGGSSELFHIQYILYDAEGNVVAQKTVLDNMESDKADWPYSGGAFSQVLNRDETYRIVYLGNIATPKTAAQPSSTAGLLKDEKNYSTARIHIPEGGFDNSNMYYFFSKEFVASDENKEIEVVLRRLVSKHSVASYGIPEGLDPGTGDYSDRFWESLLEEKHPLGLGERLFGDINSVLGKQFQAQIFRDIIFPAAYMFSLNNCIDLSTKLGQDWNNGTINKDGYWSNYTNADNLKSLLSQFQQSYGGYNWNTGNDFTDKPARALYKLIADMYADNSGIMTAMYERFKSDNLPEVPASGQTSGIPGSFTLAKQNTAKLLQTAQQNSGFGVWNYDKLNVTFTQEVPTEINLDLTVTEKAVPAAQRVTLSDKKSLDFLLLGTADENYKFSFGKIYNETEGDVTYPKSDFPSRQLLPNVAYTYRIQPKGGSLELGDDMAKNDTPDNVYLSYYNLLKEIENKIPEGIALSTLIENNGKFVYPMSCVYGVSYGSFVLTSEYGLMTTNPAGGQFHVEFHHPDFTSPNLTIETEWTVESSLSEN